MREGPQDGDTLRRGCEVIKLWRQHEIDELSPAQEPPIAQQAFELTPTQPGVGNSSRDCRVIRVRTA